MLNGRASATTMTSLATQLVAWSRGLGLALLPHFLSRLHDLTCLYADLGIDQSIRLLPQSDLARSRRVSAVAGVLYDLVKRHGNALSERGD